MKAITDRPQCVTDEVVEAAARAIYERRCSLAWGVNPPSWDTIPRDTRDEWRKIARAGLEAAGAVAVVHLCDSCAQSMCRRRRDIEDACEDPLFPARAVVVECAAHVTKEDAREVVQGAQHPKEGN